MGDGPARYPAAAAGGAPENTVIDVMVPDTLWSVQHNLGFKPAGIRVEDTAGTDIEGGDVTHISTNALTIEFSFPFAGKVYLS